MPRGRQKGAVNRVGSTAKDNMIAVFTRLEGTAGMAKWAKKNLTEFYKLYARLIPAQIDVSGDINHRHLSEMTEEQIAERLERIAAPKRAIEEEAITAEFTELH